MPTLIVFLSSLLDTRLAPTVHSATVNMSPRALFRRLAALLPAAAVTLGSAQECTFETFTSILADDPEASINFAVPVPAGGSFSQGSADVAYPANATQLPALRAVGINVRSSESSFYNFGLFLPDTTWNGRFMAGGNGGLNGGINW
jgi:feruloyl esterase